MDELPIAIRFGNQLRSVRRLKGMSQERLALNSGYHPTYISHLETGKKNPTLETIIKLSDSLDCSLTTLLKPFI